MGREFEYCIVKFATPGGDRQIPVAVLLFDSKEVQSLVLKNAVLTAIFGNDEVLLAFADELRELGMNKEARQMVNFWLETFSNTIRITDPMRTELTGTVTETLELLFAREVGRTLA